MPIIEAVPENHPLSQGDILSNVKLFVTRKCWEDEGGNGQHGPHRYCLVISRPCVALHKPNVIVSAIEVNKRGIAKDINTFEEMVEVLSGIRDGLNSPDVFYLGQLPDEAGSFCAKLDSLHTIQLPPAERMTDFLRTRRIGRLNHEFARDLHVRLFAAFASLGFTDDRWFSTPDLELIVSLGRGELAKADAELQAAKSKRAFGEAHSYAHESEKKSINTNIQKLEASINEIRQKLRPYEDELQRRTDQSR